MRVVEKSINYDVKKQNMGPIVAGFPIISIFHLSIWNNIANILPNLAHHSSVSSRQNITNIQDSYRYQFIFIFIFIRTIARVQRT